MSVINQARAGREVCAKIVYYGPGLSGKTTSLRRVFESIRPANRGEMISLATEGDRTLFFDFLPLTVERVGDATVRLALYTVPGQVFYNATRKLVLQGADGIVFVADSSPAAMDSNLESMENLKENMKEMALEDVPVVFQWNKRDLPDALPVATLRAQLNPKGFPDFETIAEKNKGVLDALKAVTKSVIRSLKAKGVFVTNPRKPSVPEFGRQEEPSLASQLEAAATAAPPVPDGSLLALWVPGRLAGDAAAAEADFRSGHYRAAFARAVSTLRAVLSTLGPKGMSDVELALMAGLTGPDWSRLLRIEKQGQISRDEAAFGLLMLGLAGVRLRK